MPPHPVPAAAAVPVAAVMPSWRRLLRHAVISAVVCLGIALILTAAMPTSMPLGRAFLFNWLYSQCIGAAIQALIETGRLALAAWLRGRQPDNPGLAAGWPGWRWFLPWLVIASVIGYLLGASLADAVVGGSHVASLLGGSLRPLVFLGGLTLGVSLLTSYSFYTRSQVEAAEARSAALAREAAEHRLRLLEAQLEPHMLFNTLANLRVLIGLDPPRAQAMLDHLNDFLRATLRASHDRVHPLAVEFARLADYLALMQVRMGPRLSVGFELPAALRDVPVPPLLLQPLVENAIRHGLEPTVDGGRITVSARVDGGMLALSVADTGVGVAPPTPPAEDGDATSPAARSGDGGFGLRQVRERLATLHGPQARFTLGPGPQGRGTVACVHLPLPAGAARTPAAAATGGDATTAAGPRPDAADRPAGTPDRPSVPHPAPSGALPR